MTKDLFCSISQRLHQPFRIVGLYSKRVDECQVATLRIEGGPSDVRLRRADRDGVTIWITKGEEAAERPICQRKNDGNRCLTQLCMQHVCISGGDPKRHSPTEQTCGVQIDERLSYSERHWFGLEDHRTGWTLWNRSEPHAFNVEGFGSLQVPNLQSDEIRPNQFGVLVIAER